MHLLREVLEGVPTIPDGGWNVGHLANLGMLLSADDFSIRLDDTNLDILFDIAESGDPGEIRDHSGRIIEVVPTEDSIILTPRDDPDFPNGIVLDIATLKEMGIEQWEEDDPASEFDSLEDNDTVSSDDLAQGNYDALDDDEVIAEGIKRAFRRSGKKIKRGFRVTSGFRKGRVVASAAAAYKPRAKASTRMKLSIAARKKKLIRILKGKRTRRKPSSQRLARMNKRLP
jgi:hypothetical protein